MWMKRVRTKNTESGGLKLEVRFICPCVIDEPVKATLHQAVGGKQGRGRDGGESSMEG